MRPDIKIKKCHSSTIHVPNINIIRLHTTLCKGTGEIKKHIDIAAVFVIHFV